MILWRYIENFHFLSLFIILIPTPDFPHFYYMLGGNLGSLLYGDVSMMYTMSINSQSTFQQIINIFNNERHKLELYVAGKEQTFNEREFALEQRVNKTIDELAKTNNE